jgi:hypothetical protein
MGTALIYAYIASIPLLITAAAAFTVGGLGGYAARWVGAAMGAAALAWAGIGVVVLPVTYAQFYVLNPCKNTTFCFSDAFFSLLVIIVVGGGRGSAARWAAWRGVARLGWAQRACRLAGK